MSVGFGERRRLSLLSDSIRWRKAPVRSEGSDRSVSTAHGSSGTCLVRLPKLAVIEGSDSSFPRLAADVAAQKQKLQRPGSFLLTATSCFVTRSVMRNSSGGAKLVCARGRER